MWWLRMSEAEIEQMWAEENELAMRAAETAHYEELASEHYRQMERDYCIGLALDAEYGPELH